MTRLWRFTVVLLAQLGIGVRASAQAPINSNVALQPSKGGLIIRQQIRYSEANLSAAIGDVDIRLTASFTTLVNPPLL